MSDYQRRVNPAELRNFAAALSRFSNEVNESIASLRWHLGELGYTWDDRRYGDFKGKLEGELNWMLSVLAQCEEFIPVLTDSASILEDYDQRISRG